MRTLVFQHTPEEVPGTLEHWLQNHRFSYHVHHLYRDGEIPPPDQFDWLVVLGGPMNVDEEDKHPWLKAEKAFIRRWAEANKPVLGICLGGQLLAQALGSEVRRGGEREIGFQSVIRTGNEHPAFRRWPVTLAVFQWHEDSFTLPSGCVSLLTSEACEHQAFARDRRTVGLQFHPESTAEWIRDNFNGFEPKPGERFVQSGEQCMPLIPALLAPMTKQFFTLLEDFVESAR
jgi:GMP synthase-like glutamine amidotransferase